MRSIAAAAALAFLTSACGAPSPTPLPDLSVRQAPSNLLTPAEKQAAIDALASKRDAVRAEAQRPQDNSAPAGGQTSQ